ncbi:hypothetical protein ID741_002069 [Enterococcus sp. AZ103]
MIRKKSLRFINFILSDSDIYLTIIIIFLFFIVPVLTSLIFSNILIVTVVALILSVINMIAKM